MSDLAPANEDSRCSPGPNRPVTLGGVAVSVILGIALAGVLWMGFIVYSLFNVPSVPDRVVPIPDELTLVDDWKRPGAEDGYGAYREFRLTSEMLGVDEAADRMLEALTAAGWEICRVEDPYGAGDWRSVQDLEGEYDLVMYADEADGVGIGSDLPIARGDPLIIVGVDTKPDPGNPPPPGECRPIE